MKNIVKILFLKFAFLCLFSTASVFAESQTLVIGGGFSVIPPFIFTSTDDTRGDTSTLNSSNYNPSVSVGVMGHLYAEFYLLDRLAIGYRYASLGASRKETTTYYSGETEEKVETETWDITHQFLTLNLVLTNPDNYARLGVIGGYGDSTYSLEHDTEITNRTTPDEKENKSYSQDGTATLIGIYADWGADGFGARAGLNAISTNYDSLDIEGTKYEIDASGIQIYFDLRWAF